MTKLEIKSIGLISTEIYPKDQENFYETIEINIGIKNERGANRYNLNIVSLQFLENQISFDNVAEYARYTLIMKYFDQETIKIHLQKIIKKCSIYDSDKAFNCLKHHLEYELEEEEY